MKNKTIYDLSIGKPVRVNLVSTTFLGYLKEIDLDRAILNPSVISYSTGLKEIAKIEPRNTTIPYSYINGIQEVDESYFEEIVNDLVEKSRLEKEKDLNKPKKDE